MVRSGILFPQLNEKIIPKTTTVEKRDAENKLEKRHGEFRSLHPPCTTMAVDRGRLGPLVEWQIHRSTKDIPDVSLRQQEAKVGEWLHKNHFKVTRLPRLDPLILTSRGVDFSKFMNFIHPATLSLKFRSGLPRRGRRNSYEEEILELKEPCPRFLRSKRAKEFRNLNSPVIRVGGGYKKLSRATADVLPSISQRPGDIEPSFICSTCGVNLAVTRDVTDDNGHVKLVVMYPSTCTNCGKDITTRAHRTKESINGDLLPPVDLTEYSKPRDHGGFSSRHNTTPYEHGWQQGHENTAPSESNTARDHSDYSDDTGFSLTPDSRTNSVFITERADGSITRLQKPPTRHKEHHHDNEEEVRDDARLTSREMEIFEGRDFKSGIRVRVRRKAEKNGEPIDETSAVFRDRISQEEGERYGEFGSSDKDIAYGSSCRTTRSSQLIDETSAVFRDRISRDGGERYEEFEGSDEDIAYGSRSSHRENSRTEETSFLLHRETKSDSELYQPGRYLIVKRKRVSSTAKPEPTSGHQSCADDESESKRRSLSRKWERIDTVRVETQRVSNSSSLVETRNRMIRHARDYPDGYTADNEGDSLAKLQAKLLTLKKESRKKSSSKDKNVRKSSNTFTSASQDGETRGNDDTVKSEKNTKSLSQFGLDNDSWDSDESLHFEPLSDDCYFSDEWDSIGPRRPRALTLDESDLPSYRERFILIGEPEMKIQRMKTEIEGSNVENGDASIRETGRKSRFKYRHAMKKHQGRNKEIVSVPGGSRRVQPRPKWDDEDLDASDITSLTAQMQTAFKPKETQTESQEMLYCKGQNCYRCGTFVNECEGTCTVCGTHCKRTGRPCKACRDVCERCGKTRARCESRGDDGGDLHSSEIGSGKEGERNNYEERNKDMKKASHSADEADEDETGTYHIATETSVHSVEILNTGSITNAKKSRKAISKKQRKEGPRVKPVNRRSRASTMDTMETTQDQPCSDEEDLDNQLEESNHGDQQTDVSLEVSKPQPSKYTKSKKRSKPSKRVISQTVVNKNEPKDLVTQESSTDVNNNDTGDEEEETEYEPAADDRSDGEPQAPTELLPQVDHKKNEPLQEIKQEENIEKIEEKIPEKVIEVKLIQKPQIPKPKLRGVQRVNAAYKSRVELNKRLQAMLKDAMDNVIADADVRVRRDSTIDYLAQYRLVDRSKVELYARAFALEDEEERGIINYEQMLLALEGIPTIQGMSRQQLSYVLQVLEIDPFSRITFKMFAVITALCEKVTTLDSFVKELVDGLDLTQTEWKLDLYKEMFYVAGDRSVTFISPNDLRIELKAGGLNPSQEDHVVRHITQSSESGLISFLDYMAYLPLFLSIHKNICSNALDMSRDKYTTRKLKSTA